MQIIGTHRSFVARIAATLALALVAGLGAAGCCGKIGENKASWAAGDTGPAVVDVSRKLPNGQLDNGLVRNGPGFQYGRVTSLTTGTRVTVVENVRTDTGYWSRIRFNGNQEGWMHQDILLKGREMPAGNHDSCVERAQRCVCGNTGRQGQCNYGNLKSGLYCQCD